MTIDAQLSTALKAVSLASKITRQAQQDLLRLQTLEKEDKSPVTVADYAAQAMIAYVLESNLGNIELVGEENSDELRSAEQSAMLDSIHQLIQSEWPTATKAEILDAIDLGNHDASHNHYWTLDPIDGTKGFLRGQQYAISLALIEKGKVKLGVLGCPNLAENLTADLSAPDQTGLIYFAVAGQGTKVIAADLSGEANSVSPEKNDQNIRICESVESAHSKHDDTARIAEHLGGAGKPARLDSQCKYAVVARGQADAYLRLPTRAGYVEKIWDHAAGMLIAEEAGMIVSDIHGKTLDFSQGAGLKNNRGIVCASQHFHASVIDAIKSLEI